uniref:deoxyribonuclease II n=1 Tax=Sinocyclocheilus rhinocerous TaxID=307959 RepID=A0A673N8G7_9TELE
MTCLIVVVDIHLIATMHCELLCASYHSMFYSIVTLIYSFKRFIIYKLPIYRMAVKGSGVDYMYLDLSVMDFQMSKHTVNSSKGALGRTLTQLYSRYTMKLANMYPAACGFMSNCIVMCMISAGVLMFDQSQGFWLTHSVPHFPPFPERNYSFPSTGKYYGQTLHCITYNYTQFPQISWQLAYLNPRMYNCSVPMAFRPDVAVMAQICDGKIPAIKNRRSLQNSQVQKLFIFRLMVLHSNLLVESWLHQAHRLPSNCSLPRHVMNIDRVCLPGPQMFKSYEDHSKWCVSYAFKDQWTCLGDLNRDSGQAGRGGGLICSQNSVIYKAFHQAMAGYKHC